MSGSRGLSPSPKPSPKMDQIFISFHHLWPFSFPLSLSLFFFFSFFFWIAILTAFSEQLTLPYMSVSAPSSRAEEVRDVSQLFFLSFARCWNECRSPIGAPPRSQYQKFLTNSSPADNEFVRSSSMQSKTSWSHSFSPQTRTPPTMNTQRTDRTASAR